MSISWISKITNKRTKMENHGQEGLVKTKLCYKCKRELPVTEFHKCRARYDGLYSYCKECSRVAHRKLRERYKNERKKEKVAEERKRVEDADALSRFTPRQLMMELHRRGYEGTLRWVQEVDISKVD